MSLRNTTVIWKQRCIYFRIIDDVSRKSWAGQSDPNSSLPEYANPQHAFDCALLPLTPPWAFLSMKKLASWEGKWLTKVTDLVQGRTGIQSLDHLTLRTSLFAQNHGESGRRGLGAEWRQGEKYCARQKKSWRASPVLPSPTLRKSLGSIPREPGSRMLPEAVAMRVEEKSITRLLPLPKVTQWCHVPRPPFLPINSWVHLSLAFC